MRATTQGTIFISILGFRGGNAPSATSLTSSQGLLDPPFAPHGLDARWIDRSLGRCYKKWLGRSIHE
jgi:Flp pilus assembly CpaE family ATPase